jgi:hypothetical protein
VGCQLGWFARYIWRSYDLVALGRKVKTFLGTKNMNNETVVISGDIQVNF